MKDIELILFLILFVILFILLAYLARYGNNKSFEGQLTLDQLKDYFFKTHNCKDCNTKLKRITENEYLGEGWSRHMGTYSYNKKYKTTFFLKCPGCNRCYTSDDL